MTGGLHGHRGVGAFLAALCVVACRREAAPAGDALASAPVPAPAAAAPAAAAPAAAAPASGLWHVQRIDAAVEVTDDQAIAGLDRAAVLQAVTTTVRAMPQVLAVGQELPTGQRAPAVGLFLTASWQLLDDTGRPAPMAGTPGGALIVTVHAHAERLVAKGAPPIAQRQVDATVPVPAERMTQLPAFVTVRLQQAATAAAAGALGELWARDLADPDVVALLADPVLWRQVAGAREAGERGLVDARPALEQAARDSRKDLAAVAAAALGRLGRPESLEVLVGCLDHVHVEVVDAALLALADLGTPDALAAVAEAAKSHRFAAIRQRAAALLEERAARKPPP